MSVLSTDTGDGEIATGLPYEPPERPAPPVLGPNPETTSIAYNHMSPRWCMVDDLWGGTETMQKAAEKWLPIMPAEDTLSYQFRLANSSFFNAFKRTVQFLVGKAFSRPIKISEDMDPALAKLMEDVDLQNRHANIFLKDALTGQVRDGHCIFMVDHSNTNTGTITEGQRKRLGLRPYVILIDPRDFLFWRSEIVDGREILTHCRVRVNLIEADGPWGEKSVTYIYVYDRVVDPDTGKSSVNWEKYLRVDGDETKPVSYVKVGDGNMNPQTEIPIVAAYGEFEGFFKSKPTLLDMMYLNVDHWRSSSDQRHILHDVRVPIKFCKGFIPGAQPGSPVAGKVTIGPDRIVATTEQNADFKYVEHNGNAIDSGFKDLEIIKSDMATMGAEKLAKKMVFTTATESMHDNTAEDSELAAMCRSLEDAWKQVLRYLAIYSGVDPSKTGSIEVNKDFGIFPWQIQYLAYLLQLNQEGKISDLLLLQMFQRFGGISDIVDLEAELKAAKIDFDKRPKPTAGVTQPKVPALPASPNPAGPAKS